MLDVRSYFQINHFNAHHVVRNQFEVPDIDFDVVDAKNAAYLLHDSCTGHLDTICCKDSIDIIRVDIILLDQRVFSCTGSLPKTTEVGAVSGDLWYHESTTIQILAEKGAHLC
jgi:hypothetical protein